MFDILLQLLFPRYCIGCNREGTSLCAICERTISTNTQVVGKGLATLYDYHHPLIKRGIWNLKYKNEATMGKYFGIALYREFFKDMLTQSEHAREPLLLIPIPQKKNRFSLRRDNHAAIIARAIAQYAQADHLPIEIDEEILLKVKDTKRQVETVGKENRKENIRDAFSVRHPERILGKNIILIDDVITTGATMNEARKTLNAYRPKRILGIAVAH